MKNFIQPIAVTGALTALALLSPLSCEVPYRMNEFGGAKDAVSFVQSDRYVGHPDEISGWNARYFKPREFASKGNGLIDIKADLVNRLDAVRAEFGRPIKIISGYRDPAHNRRVGGAKNSQHMHGIAVDIDLNGMDIGTRYRLMVLLIQHGFTSFGSYDRSPNMLHADLRHRAVTWDQGDGIHPGWFNKALRDTRWSKGVRLDHGNKKGTKNSKSLQTSRQQLKISKLGIRYIARVANTEVFKFRNRHITRQQLRAVIDTILNRMASKEFPNTAAGVLNQRSQFSKITGPRYLKPYGAVQNTPDAPKWIEEMVEQHIRERINGVASVVGGHVNYLNPRYSDRKNLETWGYAVVAQAKKFGYIFGVGKARHYHGTAKGFMQVEPFDLVICG